MRSFRYKYSNIADMQLNPAFHIITHGRRSHINRVSHFWNLVGARNYKPSKYECEICGCPMRKRTQRKYMVCSRHMQQYIIEVKKGTRQPVYHVPLVAVQ